MTNSIIARIQENIHALKSADQYRHLPDIRHDGRYLYLHQQKLLNVSSNDYLGLSSNTEWQDKFLAQLTAVKESDTPKMSATSSRLLTGNDEQIRRLEQELSVWYQQGLDGYNDKSLYQNDENDEVDIWNGANNGRGSKSALVINSGYHANIGILPALTALPINTLILADKLVHASIIDGIRLSQSKRCLYRRYRHNDYQQLAMMIEQASADIERIIIVTESIFSMDGDRADLCQLVTLKASDCRIELYVDEAHAVGVLGIQGLGLAEETKTLAEIDYLVGTFGKAFASVGAYIFCDETVKEWLINHMRPLIFSTALPPINHAWTRFILAKMPQLHDKREHLAALSMQLSQAIDPIYKASSNTQGQYQSPIVPYILGDNARAVAKANELQAAGFYALPIRPPTVPVNSARIRLVMNAALTHDDCQQLIDHL